MAHNHKSYLFILLVFVISFKTAACISCYQCNSTDINELYQCAELMDTSGHSPESCSNFHNANYCIKVTGRHRGGLGTKRFCSARDLGNYCKDDTVESSGVKKPYRTCVYTCYTDGCNGSNQVTSIGHLLPISLVSFFMIYF